MACLLSTGGALAQPAGTGLPAGPELNHWRLVLSPYTHHWRYSDEHSEVYALGIERQMQKGWLIGASYFRNSFGQPSAYAYLGRRYEHQLWLDPLYWQWSAGILYGYVGKYQRKVPLNVGGFSPGAVLSLGWNFTPQTAVQFNLLGDAAVMLQLSYAWR